MRTLHVKQSQVEYVAVFAAPAFHLWANVPTMLSGLYQTFAGLHSGLADLTVEGGEADTLGRRAVVSLGELGFFKVGYDRVETSVPVYTDAASARLPDVLARGDGWLRSSWPDAAVDAHYLTLSFHANLDQGTSVDYLRELPTPVLAGIGENLGNGLIFHVALPGSASQVHLTLDHSPELEGGLFVQYVVTTSLDRIAHSALLTQSNAILVRALASLGLAFGAVG